MKCPYCGFDDSKVIDSRPYDDKIKRRRECVKCSAIKKRPVNKNQVDEIADYVENYCADQLKTVIKSKEIGEIVLNRLSKIDPVAYIRFASVYEDFSDVASFVAAISELEKK